MSLDWKYFTDNLKKNDLPFLDRKDIDENDLRRIWKDILLHEELALEYAKKTGEVNKARTEIEKIKEEFHRKIKNRRFYTSWEAEKIIERLKPMKAYTGMKEDFSENGLLINVSCGKVPEDGNLKRVHDTCIDKIKAFTGCKFIEENPVGFVRMKCKVNDREVPVTYFLYLEERKMPEYEYHKPPSIGRLIRDGEYYG
ncbi:MAG: hypothetical protein DRN95_03615 [Candidatus Hydrothermarchaeota archaeon]|nr:MAG: hypothetical protein DRN95_03615 [Candidatus Hydrothermarchaeota archaeon]